MSFDSIGTTASRAFCSAEKASKSSGTGRLGVIFSGSKPAAAIAAAVCFSAPAVRKQCDTAGSRAR